MEYTALDFKKLAGTNRPDQIDITQLAVGQMLRENTCGSVTCVTSAMMSTQGPATGSGRLFG